MDPKVFFTNSGTEANEAAFKITRMTGRTRIVAAEGAFHGRSLGALAITHNPKYRIPFEPLPGDVTFVPYGDAEALAAAVDDTLAAVVLEPIQGENGVVVPPAGYLARARQLCDAARRPALDRRGADRDGPDRLLAGPRGRGVPADLVTVAKGLGNGFPIGACVANGRAATLLGPGSHGSTFGGNPVAAIAGLAVIAVIERDGLLARANDLGDHLADGRHRPWSSNRHRRTGSGSAPGGHPDRPGRPRRRRRRAGRRLHHQRSAPGRAPAGSAAGSSRPTSWTPSSPCCPACSTEPRSVMTSATSWPTTT